MDVIRRFLRYGLLLILFTQAHIVLAAQSINIPILCYHNFSPTIRGSMNLTPQKFESQLSYLKENGFTIISLSEAVAYLQGERSSLPPKPIVISIDDGWQSAYTYLYPIIKKHQVPVTLFIYPGTVSEGKHAVTWEELKEMKQTGLFDIQSHTYTHPNFKHEKRRRSPESYAKFVRHELQDSKQVLENKLNTKISYLAWPFGIYDSYLESAAANAGYTMSFTIDAKSANKNYRSMAEPRFMIVDGQSMKTFMSIVKGQY